MRADRSNAPALRATVPATVPRDRIVLRRLRGAQRERYYLYWPSDANPAQLPLVAVHGISLNAREQARAFAARAAELGVMVIAPLFEPEPFRDFQRLGRTGRGQRADEALMRILDDVAGLTDRAIDRVNLFGYSGGGQFCHRFTMAHPARVQRQALAAPGWYTLPKSRQRYPQGLRLGDELPGVRFEPVEFLRVPTLVLVGADDTERDPGLRITPRIDRQQGRDRVARGRSFVQRMQHAARELDLNTPFEFATLARCGHDFDECVRAGGLVSRVIDFLYQQPQAAAETEK